MPKPQIDEEQVAARIAEVNARFDAYRPPRLRVRVKSYDNGRVSIAVSDGGQPAQRKLIHVNTASLSFEGMVTAVKCRINEIIEEFYSADVARWFAAEHGDALMKEGIFQVSEGFNVTVWLP